MKKVYRCALAGLGRIAWQFDAGRPAAAQACSHAGAYIRQPKTEIVGGFAPCEKDRLDFQAAFNVPTWSRFEYLLDTQPDIVSICSPSEFHFEHAMACLERNVPMVWLEKPPAMNLKELDALLQLQETQGMKTKVLVNYSRRYSERYAILRKIFTEQILGRPLGVFISYSRGLELNGSHFLDLIFLLANDAVKFEITMNRADKSAPNPSFLLHTKAGCPVVFAGHESPYHINDIVCTAEKGRVSVLSGGLDVRVELNAPNERFPGFQRLKEVQPDMFANLADDNFSAALADLILAHETDSSPASNLQTARNTQELITRIRSADKDT